MVGCVCVMMLSPSHRPVSWPGARVKATGGWMARSKVTTSGSLGALQLPAPSMAIRRMRWVPSGSVLGLNQTVKVPVWLTMSPL